MASYALRYFFDYGAGVCLWSASEDAYRRFGYPVALEHLPLAPAIEQLAVGLLDRYDASLDWDDPTGPPVWSQQERDCFIRDSEKLLQQLRACLGEEFHIKDERDIP